MIEKLKKRVREAKVSNEGFTLVELLVAIAILAIIVVPTMQGFITATKSNSRARTQLQATITANSVLESAKAFPIYTYEKQCTTCNASVLPGSFTLIAGDGTHSFVSGSYGGKAGIVNLDASGKITSITTTAPNFVSKGERYAYMLNGIKQSHSKYDAIIIFTKSSKPASNLSAQAESAANNQFQTPYCIEYGIEVHVYKHQDISAYTNVKLDELEAVASISGSKFDTADVVS